MSKGEHPTTPLRAPGAGGTSTNEIGIGDLIGAWRLHERIADGGFGTVYAVTHAGSGAPGALKLLHAHLMDSEATVARLLREAEVLAQLRHPNIVELLDAGVHQGRPYLVMERLEGCDLGQEIAIRGRLAPADALTLIEPVCAALALAHEHGVIHRDVKASNVFLCHGARRRVVLLDFGIARVAGATDLTMSRQVLGTPASMAPEQIRGGVVDARCDVYGLGVLTYHLLVGRMPFDESSMTMAEYLHLHARRPAVSAAAPVHGGIDAAVARAMAIDPAARFPGPLAYLAALRAAIVDEHEPAVTAATTTGILVAYRAPAELMDELLLEELEELLPSAGRHLAGHGFRLALDLGDAALFVPTNSDATGQDACAIAVGTYDTLLPRTHRLPGVELAIVIHRAPLELVGDRVEGGALADLSTWPVAADHPGVVATADALLDAAGGPAKILR